jgi:predicted transcriptional regulator
MSRKDFFQLANNIAEKSGHKPDAVSVALKALMDEGLLVCEMKLTAKGLDKLGLKGPQ